MPNPDSNNVASDEQKLAAKEAAAQAKKDEKEAKAEAKKAEKAAKDVLKAKEKADKAAAKTAEKDSKAKEKSDKLAEKVKAKEQKEADRIARQMPEQHGIRRPRPESLCGQAWGYADKLSAALKQPVPIKQLLEATDAASLNSGNVRAEYARWRKFNGVTGRISLPKPAVEETKNESKG